jgi:hypothetical protein
MEAFLQPQLLPDAPVLPIRLKERFPLEELLGSDLIKQVERERPDGTIVWRGGDPIATEQTSFEESLKFDINFKSGSLHSVKQVGEREYSLRLRPDHYTQGYCSWFFFMIRPVR